MVSMVRLLLPIALIGDRVDGIDMAFRPFDGKKDQFLFSLDATFSF